MSQTIRSRKLASQLSKKYFRYRIRKITNCHYLNKQNVNRARFQKDNDESDRRQSNKTGEDGNNNIFHNIDNDNEEDDNDSNNSDTSNACGIIHIHFFLDYYIKKNYWQWAIKDYFMLSSSTMGSKSFQITGLLKMKI